LRHELCKRKKLMMPVMPSGIERMNWSDRIRLLGAPGPQMKDLTRTRTAPARPILVGIEESDSADALALADLLAGLLGGPLVLVHNHSHGTPSTAEAQELTRRYHDAAIRVTHAESPAEGLRECVAKENAQLIVVGPPWGQTLPGSVGEQLLFGARAPVAIAPRGYAHTLPSLGVVASAFDGSPESRRALGWAADLARSSHSRLRAISVHAPTVYAGFGFPAMSVEPVIRAGLERELSAAIRAHDEPVEAVVPDGDPGRTLVEASQEADILVMGSRGHGRWQAALLGSVSHYVMRHAACPVVILPRGADQEDGPLADQEPDVRVPPLGGCGG
jgi:nucleotide-binding universal stress UspA family protein